MSIAVIATVALASTTPIQNGLLPWGKLRPGMSSAELYRAYPKLEMWISAACSAKVDPIFFRQKLEDITLEGADPVGTRACANQVIQILERRFGPGKSNINSGRDRICSNLVRSADCLRNYRGDLRTAISWTKHDHSLSFMRHAHTGGWHVVFYPPPPRATITREPG